ncbi:MAG: hypothetical protein K0R00_112 [Herbinix sp.]|jgi:hypothetical protein|nr:hypothetical protein [Herbinix sp.]
MSEDHKADHSTICFWCGTVVEKKKIINTGDKHPLMVIDYAPCEQCIEKRSKGVTFIEFSEIPNVVGQAELQPGIYPTGSWAVMTEEAVRKFMRPEAAQDAIQKSFCFLDKATWNLLGFNL